MITSRVPPLFFILVLFAAAYLAAGLLVALAAHTRLLNRWDAAAARGPFFFRILITPGLVVLWPVILYRAFRGPRP